MLNVVCSLIISGCSSFFYCLMIIGQRVSLRIWWIFVFFNVESQVYCTGLSCENGTFQWKSFCFYYFAYDMLFYRCLSSHLYRYIGSRDAVGGYFDIFPGWWRDVSLFYGVDSVNLQLNQFQLYIDSQIQPENIPFCSRTTSDGNRILIPKVETFWPFITIWNLLYFDELYFHLLSSVFKTSNFRWLKNILGNLFSIVGDNLYLNFNVIIHILNSEFMCFNEGGTIYSLNVNPLKLVDKFINLSCNILSTECDVNILICYRLVYSSV